MRRNRNQVGAKANPGKSKLKEPLKMWDCPNM